MRLLCGGVPCELDAWSEYTAPASPAERQDASVVWIDEAQTALMFAGHASDAFQYFADVWRNDWPQRRWTEILLASMDPKPKTRSGHVAVCDGESKSMFILAGRSAIQVMLVFAAWNGQQFVDDLHSYDSWPDRWTELPVAGGWSAAHGGNQAS